MTPSCKWPIPRRTAARAQFLVRNKGARQGYLQQQQQQQQQILLKIGK